MQPLSGTSTCSTHGMTGGVHEPPLHIALVANTAWNLHHFRGDLIRSLQSEGYRVTAIAPPGNEVDEAALHDLGIQFFPLHRLSRKGVNPLADIMLTAELWSIYRSHRIDLALHYTVKCNIYGPLAARLSGTQSISTVTGLGYAFLRKGLVQSVVRRLYRLAFRQPGMVFFQNNEDLHFFESSRLISQGKGDIVPGSGIDPEVWAPAKSGPPQLDDEHPFRLLFVGRLLHDKGIRELIGAAALLASSNHHFIIDIVGDIDEGNPASMNAEELQQLESPWLCFRGPQRDLHRWYAQAHAVVLPSYREGLPRVLLEAQSMAIPVIATRVAGCTALVNEGTTGVLVEAQSAESLAEGIVRMMRLSFKQRNALGQAGRAQILSHYAQDRVTSIYLSAIRALTTPMNQ